MSFRTALNPVADAGTSVYPSYAHGTELELQIVDDGDELDQEEQAALDAALTVAHDEAKAGQSRPIGELLRRLERPR